MQECFKANPHSSTASVATVLAASIKSYRVELFAAHVLSTLSASLESCPVPPSQLASARKVRLFVHILCIPSKSFVRNLCIPSAVTLCRIL